MDLLISGGGYRIMNKVISFLISTLCGSLVLSGHLFVMVTNK